MTDQGVRIPYSQLCVLVAKPLVGHGVPDEIARQEAEILCEADLLGVPSHGVRMLPGLLRALEDGRVRAAPRFRELQARGAVCMVDGDNGPGRYVACRAMEMAVERANRSGVGVCLASRTTHWGRAHAYAARAAQAGMIGICTTNGMPCMAGWGAKGKIIGNNPLAIGVPRPVAGEPLVLDMAMSQAAVGKVGTWLREGKEIPEVWGVDSDGRPTREPEAILAGAVMPFGGHKGAGLALMLEIVTAALAGGPFGHEIEAGDRSGLDPDSSKLFIALDPEAFGGRMVLTRRVEEYLQYLKKVGSGTVPFLWPGERGWQSRQENLRRGVPMHADIIRQLAEAGVNIDM